MPGLDSCFPSSHPTLIPSQLRLAEVSPTLLHKVRATPRYDALMELKTHWPIDLRKNKIAWDLSPAEFMLLPAAKPRRNGELLVRMPFPQVFVTSLSLSACAQVGRPPR